MSNKEKTNTLPVLNHIQSQHDYEACVNQIEDAIAEVEYSLDSNMLFDNLIMDIKEASKFLKLSEKTLRNHLAEIPHKRIGNSIRFLLPVLIKWLKSQD